MAISFRTPLSVTAASGAGFTMPTPASTAVGDFHVAVVTNAGTAGPAAPTGWTLSYGASAGSGQFCSVFTAPYSAGLTRAFTNAASAAVAVCGSYYEAGKTVELHTLLAAVNTTNNTTLPTGAPTTGAAGMFEVLAYSHSAAPTVTTTATGSTVDLRAVNGTSCTSILGHNNTTSLGASTVCTAFSHTLSASNNRKTGVGILLKSGSYKNLTGTAAGRATVGPAGGSGILFSDDFNRANAAIGASWTADANSDVLSNQARIGTGFGAAFYAIHNTTPSTVSYTVQAKITQAELVSNSAVGLGLVARYTDSTNFYLAWIDEYGAVIRLYRVAGGYTEIGSWVTTPLSDPVTLTLSVNTDTIKVLVNGSQQISVTDSTHTLAGKAGLRTFNPGQIPGHRFDDFIVQDFTGGSSPTQITRLKPLAGTSVGSSTATGSITKILAPTSNRDLTGAAVGQARIGTAFTWGTDVWGNPVWGGTGVTVIEAYRRPLKELTGAAAGSSTAAATLTRRRRLLAVSAGVAATTAALTRRRTLSAVSAGSSTTVASPSRKRLLQAATSAGTSTATGTLTKVAVSYKELTGSAQGSSVTDGQATRRRALVALSQGSSNVFGFVDKAGSLFRPLVGAANGRAIASAPIINARRALVAVSAGTATVTVSVSRKRLLTALSTGSSAVLATPTRKRGVTGISAGRAATTGTPSKQPRLTGLAIGRATVTSLLEKRVPISRLLTGLSSGRASVTGIPTRILVSTVYWDGDRFTLLRDGYSTVRWDGSVFVTTPSDRVVVWDAGVFKERLPLA